MSGLPFTVWIATDDKVLSDRWQKVLGSQGWLVRCFRTYYEFLHELSQMSSGFALLDRKGLGPQWERELRAISVQMPRVQFFIFAYPKSVDSADVVACLEAGAADFIDANVEKSVLAAKLRAHLRRLLPSLASAMEVLHDLKGGIRADRSQRLAWVKSSKGKWVLVEGMRPQEFRLLCFFLEHPGTVLERSFILESVWREKAASVNPETLDRQVERLRRKLGVHGRRIRAVYGVGYVFRTGGRC